MGDGNTLDCGFQGRMSEAWVNVTFATDSRLSWVFPMALPLMYKKGTAWERVPDWVEFFRVIGRCSIKEELRDVTVGVLVPARAYVAAFVALGAVEASLALPPAGFEELENLEPGTRLSITEAGKQVRYTFKGYDQRSQKRGMLVEQEKNGVQAFFPVSSWGKITVGDFGLDQVPKPLWNKENQTGPKWDEKFVKGVFGTDDLDPLLVGNRLVALIVGTKVELSRELETEPFAVTSRSGSHADGHLEDAIRTRSFADNVEGDSFRTEVLSARHPTLAQRIRDMSPRVFISDNPTAFLRHRDAMTGGCRVAIFDLTARDASQTIREFDNEYAARSREEPEWPFGQDPPPGVSVSIFRSPQ